MRDGAVFDIEPQTLARYVKSTPDPAPFDSHTDAKVGRMAEAKSCALNFWSPASVHWSFDEWMIKTDNGSDATGFGTFICESHTQELAKGGEERLSMLQTERGEWEANDFIAAIGE